MRQTRKNIKTLDMQHERWHLIRSTVDGLDELALTSTLETGPVVWQMVALSMKKANGRLHPR